MVGCPSQRLKPPRCHCGRVRWVESFSWYSTINTPTESLAEVFGEFARVTRPGAPLLVAFQSGEGQRVDRITSYGLPVPLTYYRHSEQAVAEFLATTGFTLYACVTRTAALSFESTSQTALLAYRNA
jgi:hypothetical protein